MSLHTIVLHYRLRNSHAHPLLSESPQSLAMPGYASFLLGLLELRDVFSKGVGPQGKRLRRAKVSRMCIDVFVSVFMLLKIGEVHFLLYDK